MYRHLFFYFIAKCLYDIDFQLAHKFINEDLVKYAECNWEIVSQLENSYTCYINPNYYNVIPTKFIEHIKFF